MKKLIGLLGVFIAVAVIAAPNGYFKLNSDGTIDVVATEAELVTATVSGTLTAGTIGADIATEAGAGITITNTAIYVSSATKVGEIYETKIYIDLTGLNSGTTDLDIIGYAGAASSHFGSLSAAESGTTILALSMECLEAPAGGVTDIDLYEATESTGTEDTAVTALAETALLTSGGAWANGTTKAATVVPTVGKYLYLTSGAGGTDGTYTAGKFLITVYGM